MLIQGGGGGGCLVPLLNITFLCSIYLFPVNYSRSIGAIFIKNINNLSKQSVEGP